MRVSYRPMRPEDEVAVLDLWAECLAEDRGELGRAWHARGPDRLRQVRVVVGAYGGLLAAGTYSLHELHNATGRPCRVGQLDYLQPVRPRGGRATAGACWTRSSWHCARKAVRGP